MESLELRIFKEVAITKSISKAALSLGYVQSNITAHIKKLEDELHVTLFIRHNKGVTLTKKGEALLLYAEKIITLLDEAAKAIPATQTTLTIGTTQTIAGYFLPQYLAIYQKQHPQTLISMKILTNEEMKTDIISKYIDCIIINANTSFSFAKQQFQIPEKLYIIAPVSCKSIEEINTYPLITNTISSCPYRKIMLAYYHSNNMIPPSICEFDSVEGMLHAVTLGMGITLLPETVVKDNSTIHTFYVPSLQTSTIKFYTIENHSHEHIESFFSYIEDAQTYE